MKIERIRTATQIVEYWTMFLTGMWSLNKPSAAARKFTPNQFLNMLYDVVRLPEDKGLVLVARGPAGVPEGFLVARCDPFFVEEGEVLLVVDYTNNLHKETPHALYAEMEDWARKHGQTRVFTLCRRTTNAAKRRFENLGFAYRIAGFEKEL